MTIEWKSFRGHVESAGQVEAYLKGIVTTRGATADERDSKRAEAYEYFRAQLVKDGQWLPVSQHVATELVNVARTDAPGRWRVLRLLGEMVCGKHQWWLMQGVGHERVVDELEAMTRQAILPLRDDACRMLGDGDPTLRSAAAFFLGCLGAPDAATLRQLEAQIEQEKVSYALASELLALTILFVRSGKPGPNLEPYLDPSSADPFVVGTAALAGLLCGTQTPRKLGDKLFLLSEFENNLRRRPVLDVFCWGAKDLSSLEDAVVKGLGAKLVEETVDVLLAMLPTVDAKLKSLYTKRLMSYGGFVDRWKSDDRALVEELTPRQRQIAEVLAVSGPDGGYGNGLPKVRRFLTRWLGLEAPTLLDESIEVEVDGKKVKRPRWWAWKNPKLCRVEKADIDAFVLHLDVKSQLRLIVDAVERDIFAPSLKISRVVELVEQLPSDSAEWAKEWAKELMRAPTTNTEAGPVSELHVDARYALLRALLRSGVPIHQDWVIFTPWGHPHVRAVLEALPVEFRETGIYRNLLHRKNVAAQFMIPMLDLFPSRRIIEKMLELSTKNVYGTSPLMNDSERDKLHGMLAELAKTNPEIATWVDEWPAKWRAHVESFWYGELTRDPWGNAVEVAERLGLDWCSRRLVEGVLALESDEDADPDALRELRAALKCLPNVCQNRPEVKEWVDAWQAAHPKSKKPAVKKVPTADDADPSGKKLSPKKTGPKESAAKPAAKKKPSTKQ